jgi:prepilin-type N-terminal cleavage/methylation domain-containing protein
MKIIQPDSLLIHARSRHAMTLVEVMVSVAIGSIVLAVVAALTVYGARSFMALSNYSILDQSSRLGVDTMQREIRQATRLVNSYSGANSRWMLFTNETAGTSIRYSWDGTTKTLTSRQSKEAADRLVLTNCTDWTFSLWQRTPQKSLTNVFYPALSPAQCKLINMSWRCQRSMGGTSLINSESIQTAQVVLRNQRSN